MEYAYAVGYSEATDTYDVFKYNQGSDPSVIFQAKEEIKAIDFLLDLVELRRSNEEYFAID